MTSHISLQQLTVVVQVEGTHENERHNGAGTQHHQQVPERSTATVGDRMSQGAQEPTEVAPPTKSYTHRCAA